MDYRCYFLGANGRFLAVKEFTAETITQAIFRAQAALSESIYPVCELWQRSRLVHREARGTSVARQ